MYNLNYAPTTFGVTKLKRNYMWGYANKERLNTTALEQAMKAKRGSRDIALLFL